MTTALQRLRRQDSGFSLIEMMIATGLLLVVSSVVMRGVSGISQLNRTVTNRSDMFAAVRNASALLQQEVGQAGRITLPAPVTLTGAVGIGNNVVGVTDAAWMFNGEWLDIDTGDSREVVQVTPDAGADTIAGNFTMAHAANVPVRVFGGFANGVIPSTVANGSDADELKIFGDINGNGQMVYVEYACDFANRRLIRNAMDFRANAKPMPTVEQVLVDNLVANPNGTPCFTYQQKVVSGNTYVVGVAITLTVESRDLDPITGQRQRESKALLNVSPRNVFNVWQNASLLMNNRIQPTPATVTALLAPIGVEEEE